MKKYIRIHVWMYFCLLCDVQASKGTRLKALYSIFFRSIDGNKNDGKISNVFTLKMSLCRKWSWMMMIELDRLFTLSLLQIALCVFFYVAYTQGDGYKRNFLLHHEQKKNIDSQYIETMIKSTMIDENLFFISFIFLSKQNVMELDKAKKEE